jgi:hypothetical protein
MDILDDPENLPYLNISLLLKALNRLHTAETVEAIHQGVETLRGQLALAEVPLRPRGDEEHIPEMSTAYLLGALDQIGEARSLERARYYTARLIKSITEEKTSPINDINLNRWKDYPHILTDSLWLLEHRDSSGVHAADYWGNFVPQIPHQLMLRYTRRGEVVLDPFAGLGTTLIEGQRLGRHTLGIELQPDVAERARQRIASEDNPANVVAKIVTGDSIAVDYPALLQHHGLERAQLVILHPPYFDIIPFSDDPNDLSNAPSLEVFLAKMGALVERVATVLDTGRYLALVIGDKYADGEWIPLGFHTMDVVQQRGFVLKSIVVKNFGDNETTAKRSQKELWRYRALVGGFYIFKHEYIFLFRKQ